MAILKNILIFILSVSLAAFFVYDAFSLGASAPKLVKASWIPEIKKSIVSITGESQWKEVLSYRPYLAKWNSTGTLALDLGRLASAFVTMSPSLEIWFSWSHNIQFKNLQGIVSLYDPFSVYELNAMGKDYSIKQITNGSLYISDEPDGTVSVYSIDAVVELSFFDKNIKMTSLILFPGMYIRFDPQANRELEWADLFRIMLILGDDKKNGKNTGITFVNPRVDIGTWEDIFFVSYLPANTRPLFQMLHLLFRERIDQADLIKNYSTDYSNDIINDKDYIFNPSKKNYYLLDDLRAVLSKAVMTEMNGSEFRDKVELIYTESKSLVKGNSVNATLEWFLTDTRFATYVGQNNQLDTIYRETANILWISPPDGKWKFFQYLSDIYSRNIIARKKDPTFSGIDTYTPTANGLSKTLENNKIESKDYFDIALYTYQILRKAQDREMFTEESLSSEATYKLIETLFGATEKYIQWIPDVATKKSAYQSLVVQFYMPIANALSKSLYKTYTINKDGYIYFDPKYIKWDVINLDPKIKNSIDYTYNILNSTYERVAILYDDNDQKYALIGFHDAMLRIGAFSQMATEWEYRSYTKNPSIGIDINDIFVPSITSDWKIEKNNQD